PTNSKSIFTMSAVKLSVSLPDSLAGFVESYRKRRGLKSRSQVFEEAVRLLRSRELETAYREASTDRDKVWESTVSDGLGDETW
ncbi:MAG TPA: ribbon-helix-helix domain-containing protein, partial [Candidatus Binataceae bacterium]|nr:ribbon-helix-helix domain-containing protein [Candidatus Binataceae bacterium]